MGRCKPAVLAIAVNGRLDPASTWNDVLKATYRPAKTPNICESPAAREECRAFETAACRLPGEASVDEHLTIKQFATLA